MPVHLANARELANIARELRAEVLEGDLGCPSETGGWQVGDVDLGEYLEKYRDQKVMLIVASVSEADREGVTCGVCGFVLDEVGECPRCKLVAGEMARDAEAQRDEMREALFREIGEILGQDGDEPDGL